MEKIDAVFSTLIGQLAWSVRRGHGRYLTMEFGRPHVQVRNPIESKSVLQKVRENSSRRRVFLHGQWSLFVSGAGWTACFDKKMVACDDKSEKVDEVLRFIDGQMLENFYFDVNLKMLKLDFDLGGEVEIHPSPDDAGWGWTLNDFDNGVIYCCSGDGGLRCEAAAKCDAGKINEI